MVQVKNQSPEAELYSEAAFHFLKMNRASSEVLMQVDEPKYSSKYSLLVICVEQVISI